MTQPETIRVIQTHNAAGEPAPGETILPYKNTASTTGWNVVAAIKSLHPTRTTDPTVFTYSNPTTGSGTIRLEGFKASDVTRANQLVQIEEVSRVVGHDPIPKDDLTVGRAALLRSASPWPKIILGVVVIALGLFGLLDPRGDPIAVSMGFGALFIVMGLILTITSILSLIWRTKARAYLKQKGEELPPDLTNIF